MFNQIIFFNLGVRCLRFTMSVLALAVFSIYSPCALARDSSVSVNSVSESSTLWKRCGIFTDVNNVSTFDCEDENFEKMENLFYSTSLMYQSWDVYDSLMNVKGYQDMASLDLNMLREDAYRKCSRDLNCISEIYAKETKKLETRIKGFENEIGEKIDCRGQLNPTDSFICKDPVLWSMEQKLRDMYFTGGGTFPQKIAWAQQKNNCSIKRTCLLRLYSRRIKELKPYQP